MPVVLFIIERYLEWKFGAASTVAFALLLGGTKSGSSQITTAGAMLLAVVVVGTAL
ncbi:hypothetical protein ACIRD4_13150 [Streptomyces clavifer]|uniref:hypothetical protein n=1 Tax=Streptomyces clavifer TaxID=68188 RepID=UPI00380342BD